jgi:Family of unknown function (DUF6600)
MKATFWLKTILGALGVAALLAAPGVPVPGADRLGLGGTALAQETIDIDSFYDELSPYGQWVWHPRFGYVWLPEDVSPNWRPYTVGHWVSTEEYGWYWESPEPYGWAVYHYGRWGYDPDYGWFWVPGDTWAPAWVQWRYDDAYVGWAPIGPRRPGYAYGLPVSYEPPIAEAWVFVRPRYMTSRAIPHYAVPIGDLGTIFIGATRVYRPQFRDGVVYNYGIPRDYVVRITKRPIYVKKVYKVDNWKGGRYDKGRHGNGIRVYAPSVHKNHRPDHRPKHYADHPDQFKPKARLNHTVKGDVPKGWGPSAKHVKSIAKEEPDAFKRHGRFDDRNGFDRKDKDQANQGPGGFNRDNNKGQTNKTFQPGDVVKDHDKNKNKNKNQANRDRDDRDRKGGRDNVGTAPSPTAPPPIVKGHTGQSPNDRKGANAGGANEFKQGNRDRDRDRDNKKNKNFGGQNGQGGNQAKAFDQGGQGGGNHQQNKDRDRGDRGNKNNNKNFGGGGQGGGGQNAPQQAQRNQGGGGGGGNDKKCQKHPEKPECQGRN